jgi:hypothetical protein
LIFTSQIIIAQAGEKQVDDNQSMEKSTLDFLRNLKLVVNKLHVRFEDDLLMPE